MGDMFILLYLSQTNEQILRGNTSLFMDPKLDQTGRVFKISTACDFKQTQNLSKIYFYAKMFGL